MELMRMMTARARLSLKRCYRSGQMRLEATKSSYLTIKLNKTVQKEGPGA